MLRLLKNRKAQSTAEYALLLALVIAAFTAMQIYVRRGLNARLKAGTDSIPFTVLSQAGDSQISGIFGNQSVTQYEPYYIREGSSNLATTSSEGTEQGTNTQTGGVRDLTGAASNRTGEQVMSGYQNADTE